MKHHFVYGNVTEALPHLFDALLAKGQEVGSRNGRCLELDHVGIMLENPQQREFLVPGRKANLAAQIAESMWVLAGRNDLEFLSHYLPRAKDFSDDGETWRAGYGPRLRFWQADMSSNGVGTDQLAEVVRLLKEQATTRRAVMSIFDPGADYGDSKDIPCNNWITFSNRLGQLDMHVGIRSNDAMWGWSGINTFEWSVIHEIVAGLVGVEIGAVHFSTTSFHLYEPHWSKAEKIAHGGGFVGDHLQESPRFNPHDGIGTTIEGLDAVIEMWFGVEELIRAGAPPADWEGKIENFPEPMMRSWLCVLAWWWTGDYAYLTPLYGTRLGAAAQLALEPPKREEKPTIALFADGSVKLTPKDLENQLVHAKSFVLGGTKILPEGAVTTFLSKVFDLHAEKHAAYGDSWKRRGEMLGILANIARKVDRLERDGETSDETSADTAIDLMVYLAKYRAWLHDAETTDTVDSTHWWLAKTEERVIRDKGQPTPSLGREEAWLASRLDKLEERVRNDEAREALVEDMLAAAYGLATRLAGKEEWVKGNATRSWNPEPDLVNRAMEKGSELVRDGHSGKLRRLLHDFGVTRITELEENQLEDFLEALEGLK